MLIAVLLISAPLFPFAQNIGINNDGSSPDSSAMLDVNSMSKGILIPRMTKSEIEAISNPANGLQVHCTSDNKMYIFVGTVAIWKEVAYGYGGIIPGGGGTCGQPFTDVRDGKIYTTVLIVTQCWMAQNLNVGVRINSTINQTNNGIIEKYCYANLESNCHLYGGLYQWDEVMQYVTNEGTQGICPAGWHIPTNTEWTTLTNYLGIESIAGGKIKATGTIQAGTGLWNEPNTGATNSSGFTALPGGFRGDGGGFGYAGLSTDFWSSTEYYQQEEAILRLLYFDNSTVLLVTSYKHTGYSVRCIKD